MKIAHIAPPWITIPPKNYGGTEIVLYNLIEEQVAHGHDVTLFAPGDARTSARLISFFPHALIDAGVPWQGHLKAQYISLKPKKGKTRQESSNLAYYQKAQRKNQGAFD